MNRDYSMYGLFKYSYDYYTWEDLVCVSERKTELVKRAIELDKDLLIVDLDENKEKHFRLSRNETTHFVIYKIEVV